MWARILALATPGILAACTNVHVNRAALIASTAALSCDWAQTHAAADRGWQRRTESGQLMIQQEDNPLIGPHPSTGEVGAYFLGAIALNAAAWVFLPRRWSTAVFAGVVAAQATSIVTNSGVGLGVCGM